MDNLLFSFERADFTSGDFSVDDIVGKIKCVSQLSVLSQKGHVSKKKTKGAKAKERKQKQKKKQKMKENQQKKGKASPAAKKDSGGLHPSWAAKKQQKGTIDGGAVSKGKKIKFDN